jgi:hypothetical protein
VGKHPRINAWQQAFCDITAVDGWWAQWPNANIGLRLDDLVCLDVDGEKGLRSLAALELEHGPFDRRAYQRSGSGGLHILFDGVPGVKMNRGFLPGLDFLCGNVCYVVAEPSLHKSGNQYQWFGDVNPRSARRDQIPLVAPPAWLLRVAATQKPKAGATAAERVPVDRIIGKALENIRAGAGRNDTGLAYFVQLRDNQYSRDEALLTVRDWVAKANEAAPGQDRYTLTEAKASLRSAYTKDPREPWDTAKRTNTAKILEGLSCDIELFHSPKGEAFARVPVNGHLECCAIESKTFKGVLTSRYFRQQNATPGRDALQSFTDLLCARAVFDGPERETYLRFAHVGQRAYLDLANDAWEVVEIDADGWRVSPESPVCFRRVAGMKALPTPEQGGSLDTLRRFINAREDAHWVLMIAWLVGVFLPKGSFPILLLQGSQGSAKSTTATLLRNVVDPATVPLSAPPRDERELAITATNSGIVAFDNLSGVHQWLSDALCRIATGAGFRTRTLHTDADEQLFETRSPLLLNGIDEIASRADLLDRGIGVTLSRISDEQRKTEEEVQTGFHAAHGAILGALLTAISRGLRNLPSTKLSSLPRMADFAKFVIACEPALPWKPGTFMREYLDSRQQAAVVSVDNDPVAQTLLRMAQGLRPSIWEGRAEELLSELNKRIPFDRREAMKWPTTPASLGKWLRRAEPSLLAVGVTLTEDRSRDRARTRLLRVEYSPDQQKLLQWPEQGAA